MVRFGAAAALILERLVKVRATAPPAAAKATERVRRRGMTGSVKQQNVAATLTNKAQTSQARQTTERWPVGPRKYTSVRIAAAEGEVPQFSASSGARFV